VNGRPSIVSEDSNCTVIDKREGEGVLVMQDLVCSGNVNAVNAHQNRPCPPEGPAWLVRRPRRAGHGGATEMPEVDTGSMNVRKFRREIGGDREDTSNGGCAHLGVEAVSNEDIDCFEGPNGG
jgi:hypothetical protein